MKLLVNGYRFSAIHDKKNFLEICYIIMLYRKNVIKKAQIMLNVVREINRG